MQKDILEKAGEIIKKDQGIFLEALTNQEKTTLIHALRPKYKLYQLLTSIDIPKSSYCYHKKQLALPNKYNYVRVQIIDIFKVGKCLYAYRWIHASLKNIEIILSKKSATYNAGKNLVAKSIKMRKYSSYDGEISPVVPNILK
ncbi:hypothetical protein BN1048_00592 [Jeotgalicoccus saudimassiliensis]|uniref:Uncharacterized protein n=1 Tax=Jeotgalicoccus saudimassiliensis TaxID=1461582 RepID=A0A078LWY0_9STAP|nr:hypothetical protein BN1048_00592 [Jeotgalicoccus saudimassiliensis]